MLVKAFEEELRLINDEKVDSFVRETLESADPRHVYEPASSTGKYHPAFALGEGGLVRHTKAVVAFTIDLLRARPDLLDEDYTEDVYIAAAILHDMAKYHGSSKYTQFDHPAEMASKCIHAGFNEIASLIGPHMGRWNTSNRESLQLETPKDERQWLLHYADYIASRTWIKVDFDSLGNLVK